MLGQPEILLGIIPGAGGTQRLARAVGASPAKELCITGRQMKSDEALRIGLADEVVPNEQLHERALALAAEVAKGARQAQALTKAAVDRGLDVSLADGLLIERTLFAEVFATGDIDVVGGKTGFIGRSGYCLATLLRLPQSGQQVAFVVMGAKSNASRFWETRHLFNWMASRTKALLEGDFQQQQQQQD